MTSVRGRRKARRRRAAAELASARCLRSSPRAAGRAGSSRLPAEIREQLDALLRSGVTQKEILAHLAPLLKAVGEKPLSYSSLNRYATRMTAAGQRIREMREMTDAWAVRVGEKWSNVGAYTIELLRTLVNDLTLQVHEG